MIKKLIKSMLVFQYYELTPGNRHTVFHAAKYIGQNI